MDIVVTADSLSMLGACVGWAGVPVEPAVEEGVVPGLEVEVLLAWGEAALEAEVLPPSAGLRDTISPWKKNTTNTRMDTML